MRFASFFRNEVKTPDFLTRIFTVWELLSCFQTRIYFVYKTLSLILLVSSISIPKNNSKLATIDFHIRCKTIILEKTSRVNPL